MESSYFNHKARTKKFGVIVGWIFLGIIAAGGFAILFGYVVMLLWNWLMPLLFGLSLINFWQAVGIIILAKLLFGGFGGHKHKSDRHHKRPSKSKSFKSGFAKWKHYDTFWKEEGEDAYKDYIRKQKENAEDIQFEEKPLHRKSKEDDGETKN